MTASSDRESAKIYQFPLRGRFAATRREETNAHASHQVAKVAVGSGWYHEAAIQDEENARKH